MRNEASTQNKASPVARAIEAEPAARRPLVIGCGALARELVQLTRKAGLPAMDLTCLPASLHNRPERIPAAVAARIRRARAQGYERIFVAYADCGTGGLLDKVLEDEGIARLEGAHCYEVYAGRAAFAALHDAEPGTFYLTDYLVRNFERLVVRGLGLDRHPELLPIYFGNYRRLVYLAQTDDPTLTELATEAAERLGCLAFERRLAGLGDLRRSVASFAAAIPSRTRHQTLGLDRPAFHATAGGIAAGESAAVLPRVERPAFHSSEERPTRASAGGSRRSMERRAIQRRVAHGGSAHDRSIQGGQVSGLGTEDLVAEVPV
jgi:hypothetical protein